MRGTHIETLKVIRKPAMLDDPNIGGRNNVYKKIIDTLRIMDSTNCIQLTEAEMGAKSYGSFRQSLRLRAVRSELDFKVAVHKDEFNTVFVWKRPIVS